MRNFLTRMLKIEIDSVLFPSLLLFCCMMMYRCFSSFYIVSDTIEHMRASSAVFQGMVPYRDFFEHHNPLLWYLLAPFSIMFHQNIIAVHICRVISVCVCLISIYVLYIINVKYVYKNKTTAKFITMFLISVPTLWLDANLRPDSFMLLFFLIGCLTYFMYQKQHKLRYLILSYLSMSISFLFLQKVLFCLLAFGIVNILDLIKKRTKILDFIAACVIGSLPVVLFIAMLCYWGIFTDYIYYNYTYNANMIKFYDGFLITSYAISVFSAVVFLFICRIYRYSWRTWLFFLCFLANAISLIYFAPFNYYFVMYFFFSASLLGPILLRYQSKGSEALLILMFVFSLVSIFPPQTDRELYRELLQVSQCLHDNNLSDEVLSFDDTPINLFKPIDNYYWFGYSNVPIDLWHNPDKHFSIDEYIKQKKPKYLVLPEENGVYFVNILTMEHGKWFRELNSNLMKSRPKDVSLEKFAAERITNLKYSNWYMDEAWIAENYIKDPICSIGVLKRKD